MQSCEPNRHEWNEFVAAHPYGDVLQCWEWGELKSRTGWEPLHFCVRRDDRLAATALVLKRPLPHTRRSLFYCPRGPLVDPTAPEALGELVACIRRGAREHGGIALKTDPAVPASEQSFAAALRQCGFAAPKAGGHGFGATQPRSVMKVDISRDEDDLLASFHSKWRYNLRLAARKGVTVTTEVSPAAMDVFYDVLQVTAERDGFRVRARSYFQDLLQTILEPGLGTLFLAHAGEAVASGAIAFALGRQCWYVYGASDNEHRNLMPNHLMQWEMMRWAKAQGCTVYDMRGVSPEVKGEPTEPHIAGLNRFKRGFGAEYVEYLGDWDLVFSPLWYALFERLLPVVRQLKSRGRQEHKSAEGD